MGVSGNIALDNKVFLYILIFSGGLMLTVEKIGGVSMSKFQDVLKNIIIGNRKKGDYYNRIFVVSAYENVTNWLLEHKNTGEPGVYARFAAQRKYDKSLDEVLTKLLKINRGFIDIGLAIDVADNFIKNRIREAKNYLHNMANVLASGYLDRDSILLAAREVLASIGEAHSAFNSVNILENNNINSTFVDLCGFEDSELLSIDKRIHKKLEGIDFSKTLAIVTGYTKGTEGIMREFDRGYSEVTFSKVAVEVGATEAVIHKEFHLSSADPKVVGEDKAIPVGFTNFNVADQLADIGMEAIHPKASKPIEMAGINIRIKNTFEPEHEGTLISKDYVGKKSRVEVISGSDKVVVIEVHDPLMVGEVGADLEIMQILKKHKVSYILKATDANSISMVIWEKDSSEELLSELKKKYYRITVKKVAVLCVVGTNIASPGILERTTKLLADNKINVECVSQSLQQVNMQFVINRKDYNRAVIALNDALCVNYHE
jgi:aspartate kinase